MRRRPSWLTRNCRQAAYAPVSTTRPPSTWSSVVRTSFTAFSRSCAATLAPARSWSTTTPGSTTNTTPSTATPAAPPISAPAARRRAGRSRHGHPSWPGSPVRMDTGA
ncbi:hypothetical protein [Streptomyces leeuwenhoekii]|uniref:hypothetical protein n=1 Tax=Streptomyces leeuwenhoekii TaxID=1437453 RepID=UPI002795AA83|nr:hypothetical protein [Streptomyces leeuwenhoekii]